MTTYGREEIEQRAFSWGTSQQRAHFLVSRVVAQRVGEEARRTLKAQGYRQADHPQFILVEADQQWPGTFTVCVRLPGLSSPDPSKAEKLAAQQARKALKAAVRPQDRVQTWTRPGRR